MYRYISKQKLNISIEEAWLFLSNPTNLKIITPPHMSFEVISGADRAIYAGQVIRYKVRPLFGIPLTWVTEITHVNQGSYFVDEQRFGPYTFWHHKHFIKAVKGGVEMEDIVDYKIPFGVIGTLVHKIFIRRQIRDIFEFRRKKLNEIFRRD